MFCWAESVLYSLSPLKRPLDEGISCSARSKSLNDFEVEETPSVHTKKAVIELIRAYNLARVLIFVNSFVEKL